MARCDPAFGGAFSVQLPPELWIAVLSQIRPEPESAERDCVVARLDTDQNKSRGDEVLQNVSMTCRSLHDLALPIRFRHVKLHAGGRHETKPTELYIRLATSETLRNFVKVVSLGVYGGGYPHLPDSAQDILCGMLNLEDIRPVTPFQMTAPLYSHICSLHSVHRLEITTLRVYPLDIIEVTPIPPDRPSINSLSVMYGTGQFGYRSPRGPGPPRIGWGIPPPWLASMACSSSIRHLRLPVHARTDFPTALDQQTVTPPSPHLITLEVAAPGTMPQWEEFWQFISLSPLVTTLIFSRGIGEYNDTTPDPPLPSKLLPALKRFEGALRYAKLGVPGRPVGTIVLTSLYEKGSLDLRPLTLSTTNILSLEITGPSDWKLVAMIGELFLHLEEFRTAVWTNADLSKEWLQKHFASDIGRLQYLRTLGLSFGDKITVEEEEDALSRVPAKHPLENAEFSSCSHRRLCTVPVAFGGSG